MIDRKTAIEELNSKICFIPEKYIDSDMSVKDILEKDDWDFMSTEGEIAALLNLCSMTDMHREMNNIRNRLDFEKLQDMSIFGALTEKLEGKLQLFEEIKALMASLNDNTPNIITRDKIAEAEKYLDANIVDKNEIQTVLHDIISILFNVEIYSNKAESVCAIIDAPNPKSK